MAKGFAGDRLHTLRAKAGRLSATMPEGISVSVWWENVHGTRVRFSIDNLSETEIRRIAAFIEAGGLKRDA